MPRPRRCRRVGFNPDITYFKPIGIRKLDLKESVLTIDEFESIRLKDLMGLDQIEAAKRMNISQPTFHRLVLCARKKVAEAIVNGKAIRIQGGTYKMVQQPMQPGMGRGMGQGRGRMRGQLAGGPGGMCRCPKCGHEQSHTRGQPCYQMKCPKCDSPMVRG